ncbi:ELMO domain-containing protein A [Dendrobium catenatum]|uniref:ELMO domain-containing protein A n=1 Tax=Dendrobium catenatum TaxID=906689 RepID=UPI0010A0807A|nr:ELMO domain-containing protein A [Dendrobium catenatum]XP_028548082.1 ELMO domain-containing protein A [Dendrobium catenatum]XP_028548083.1 ELMO domain-containing protein A [Dendrobium catenatum]
MSTKTTRRRQHHGEIDDSKDEHLNTSQSDSLRETLLAEYDSNDRHLEDSSQKSQQKIWDQKQREPFCMTCISQFVNSCIRWIASIVVNSGSILGRLLCLQSVNQCGKFDEKILFSLSPLQEERLQYLKKRLDVSFDISRFDHQVALKQLWKLAYPQRELPPIKSEKWKDMGWQSADPSTDFRSAGFLSLENLIFFAMHYPESFQRILHKQDGKRSEFEYPFAAAGVNISFMLTQMLGLQPDSQTTIPGSHFLELLELDDMAFDRLYCVAFQLLDSLWLSKHATYMEFNEILKSTRAQLEKELLQESVSRIEDLPAYRLLNR